MESKGESSPSPSTPSLRKRQWRTEKLNGDYVGKRKELPLLLPLPGDKNGHGHQYSKERNVIAKINIF